MRGREDERGGRDEEFVPLSHTDSSFKSVRERFVCVCMCMCVVSMTVLSGERCEDDDGRKRERRRKEQLSLSHLNGSIAE